MDRTHIARSAVAVSGVAGTALRTVVKGVEEGKNPIHDKMVELGVVPATQATTSELPVAADSNPVEAPGLSVDSKRPRGRRKAPDA